MKKKINKTEKFILVPNENKFNNKSTRKKKFCKSKLIYFLIVMIIILFQLFLNFIFFHKTKTQITEYSNPIDENSIPKEKLEDIDVNILNSIQDRLDKYIELQPEEQKYFNGLLRKYKPKKVVEIGVSAGGSSALILNAIKDIPNAKLYSIDRYYVWYFNHTKPKGWLVNEKFPEFLDKWTLYIGKDAAEVMETIGNNIDLVFIDTFHLTPGEMLNWLEVLPFLKEGAIVVFHDTFLMFAKGVSAYSKSNYSNNQLLCYIRGTLILPSYGDEVFSRNIGAIKLDKNQKNYYEQYFMALGNQWEGFPEEKDIKILREYFKKYYNDKLVEIFDDAVKKNRERLEKGIIKTIQFD